MKVKTVQRKKRKQATSICTDLVLPKDYPWKVLSWLTSDLAEMFDDDERALLSQIIRDRDEYSYRLLSDMWGLQCINLTEDALLCKIRAKYLISALLKKYRFPGTAAARIDSAKQKFFKAEGICAEFNHGGYLKLIWGKEERDASIYTHMRSFLQKLLGEKSPSHSVVTRWSRHGPGSNLDTCKGSTSLLDKFENWPYSCTSAAIPYARFLISTDRRWLGALEDDYRARYNIPKHAILNIEKFWENVIKVVPGNRITFVPKDALTERTIAIEPAMNLMLQLGVDGYIRSRLKRYDVDLDSQEKNQAMAFKGSLGTTGDDYVTLDLSMASDTISRALVKHLLPDEWYQYLNKLQSPQGELDGETILYEKFSSMGNGFTFALESAIFTAAIYAVHMVDKGSVTFKTDFAVFGDDLIVRKHIAQSVIDTLSVCGFSLNLDKSFINGRCRESCGTDWYKGSPVRPVFFDEAPNGVQDLLVDVNRLGRILSLRWGIEESLTVNGMVKWLPEKIRKLTGPRSDTEFDSHLHVPTITGRYKNCRWVYKRLIKRPLERKSKSFLFRKLMHNLKGPHEQPKPFHGQRKLAGAGSRFTVIKNNSFTVGTTYSHSDFWNDKYAEQVPGR